MAPHSSQKIMGGSTSKGSRQQGTWTRFFLGTGKRIQKNESMETPPPYIELVPLQHHLMAQPPNEMSNVRKCLRKLGAKCKDMKPLAPCETSWTREQRVFFAHINSFRSFKPDTTPLPKEDWTHVLAIVKWLINSHKSYANQSVIKVCGLEGNQDFITKMICEE